MNTYCLMIAARSEFLKALPFPLCIYAEYGLVLPWKAIRILGCILP